ncbi:MAG: class I SAM-dependent methyltransferase [Ignavibacteria bacterium]|nr:class I SAM-dependent methyltransferase [Ignavibacteria bacterium]
MADLKAGENLLDIGIGTGLLEEMISEEINVYGIDISEKMMEKIKQKI